jgi:hypothetical protein
MTVCTLVLLLGAAAVPGKAGDVKPGVDVFPEQRIFLARVVQAPSPAWGKKTGNRETRQVEVALAVEEVLKGGGAPSGDRTMSASVLESRLSSGRVDESAGFWLDRDFEPGEVYLVFGDGPSLADVFSRPAAAFDARQEPAVVEDVRWILAGQKLEIGAQGSRLIAQVRASKTSRSLFFGRYLAVLALASEGPTRRQLLETISQYDAGALAGPAESEALRALHVGILGAASTSEDAVGSLLSASLRALAASPTGDPEQITPTLESVVQVYLPWIAKSRPDWKTRARSALSAPERTRAAEALKWLAGLARFAERDRDVLRQLAASLG